MPIEACSFRATVFNATVPNAEIFLLPLSKNANKRSGDIGKRRSSSPICPGTVLAGLGRRHPAKAGLPCTRTNTAELDAAPLKRQMCDGDAKEAGGIPAVVFLPTMPMQLPQYALLMAMFSWATATKAGGLFPAACDSQASAIAAA